MCIKTKAKAKHKVTLKQAEKSSHKVILKNKQQVKITIKKGYANLGLGGTGDENNLPNINELIVHYNIGAL